MPHWREEYLAALAVRDQREKANVELYDAFTRLADRSAQLAIPIDSGTNPAAGRRSSVVSESQQPVSSAAGTVPKRQPSSEPGPSLAELLKITRADLSEAQRSRTELQDQLNRLNVELDKLLKKSQRDGRRLDTLESERGILGKRLKDRDEELREKTKLLEDFQAELASLNLEFNMAEKRSKELQQENKELVDRWMARMGQEADAMNDASKFS
ncbi:Autophagy protein 16 [Penicillium cataractarum]|uniref:Autophagy protein 16 n=1 Tax=Penicillium cataractarum TaxID=2100454 RepID=A0A9W9S2R0_9EURO|nr:Autophagy protein 16 [Penicillium cataractarum]KAJ5370820.1 Autophagy protein 16 [Penicillium cataractarum]